MRKGKIINNLKERFPSELFELSCRVAFSATVPLCYCSSSYYRYFYLEYSHTVEAEEESSSSSCKAKFHYPSRNWPKKCMKEKDQNKSSSSIKQIN